MIMIIFKNRFLMKEEIYEKIHSSNKKKYDVKTIIININICPKNSNIKDFSNNLLNNIKYKKMDLKKMKN